MGNILGGGDSGSGGALGSFGGQDASGCCDPKVDLISLLVSIGAIAAISVFLRQAVIDNNIMGRKRKRDIENHVMGPGRKRRSFVWQGILCSILQP